MADYREIISHISRRAVWLRAAVWRRSRDKGSIGLSGVFELGNGLRSFRLTCELPASCGTKPKVYDFTGHRLKAKLAVIACELNSTEETEGDRGVQGNNHGSATVGKRLEMKHVVISIVLPAMCDGFCAILKGAGVICVDRKMIDDTVWKRDLMMVNPGNDGLYHEWVEHDLAARDLMNSSACHVAVRQSNKPLFSIVTPVFNTPVGFLNELIESVRAQTYGSWEHILVNASPNNDEVSAYLKTIDDERFKVITLEGNRGIADNTIVGIEAARGDYIAFVDHDDVLDPFALEEYAKVIAENLDVDMLYCDEDSLSQDGTERFAPIFKPEFNEDLMLSRNQVIHMLAVSRRALDLVAMYDDSVSGAQDYDLALKVSQVAERIARIPKVLYHWRQHDASTSHTESNEDIGIEDFMPSMVSLYRHLASQGIDADVTPHDNTWLYRIAYPRCSDQDVALVIESNGFETTNKILKSIATQRVDILKEIVVVGENEDHYPVIDESIQDIVMFVPAAKDERTKVLDHAIRAADASYIVFVDSNVAFIPECDAIGLLRDALVREDVGIASTKAMTFDRLNLHVGLCIKEDGSIGYLNQGFIHGMGGGYNGYAECQCDYSAVDMMCVAFRKQDFINAGGFSGEYSNRLARDVDFSFRMRGLGKLVMVDPEARVMALPDPSKLELGKSHLKGFSDLERLWSNWGDSYRKDVLYNPNYSMEKSFFNLRL